MTDWHADWQNPTHAINFDWFRFSDRNLIRNYECLNDVRLLNEQLKRTQALTLVEVGCSTGEFYRYLRLQYPEIRYVGFDISQVAIRRAKEKYPKGQFALTHPENPLAQSLRGGGLQDKAEIIYSKDVVHHQPKPFEFMKGLLQCASVALIVRIRTRDVGPTELNPELSCQYHYAGWMPYIVMNLEEVIDQIREAAKEAEIRVYRHPMILGGQVNRYLPRDCYLKETGTAETAVGVFLKSDHPGKVTVENREDEIPRYTLDYRLRCSVSTALKGLQA